MKNADFKLVGIFGIVFGIFNIIPIFAEPEWYKIFCFLILSIPEVIIGVYTIRTDKPNRLRTQSWVNALTGTAIITLAFSSFYASQTLSVFNFIAATGLILSGVYGIVQCGKKYKIAIVP